VGCTEEIIAERTHVNAVASYEAHDELKIIMNNMASKQKGRGGMTAALRDKLSIFSFF